MLKKWYRAAALAGSALYALAVSVVHADTGSITFPNPLGSSCTDLTCPAKKILGFFWAVGIPLSTIMVMWGGFQMMTSAGDSEKFLKGRNTLVYAAIGLIVLLLSFGAASIIQDLLGGTSS